MQESKAKHEKYLKHKMSVEELSEPESDLIESVSVQVPELLAKTETDPEFPKIDHYRGNPQERCKN